MDHTLDPKRFAQLVDAACRIPREVLADEPYLLVRKWPEYGFMSPLQATIVFTRAYREAFRASFRANIDRNRSETVLGVNSAKLRSVPGELTRVWKARQRADALGMRYEDYLGFAFRFATDRKRKMLPRPNQLHPTARTEVAWNAKMKQHLEDCPLRFATPLPQHDLAHDQGLPAQKAFRLHRIQVHRATYRNHLVGMREDVVTNRLLEMRHFATFVRSDVFEDFRKQVEEEVEQGLLVPAPIPQLQPADLQQSCFGLPGPDRGRDKVCAKCPQISSCVAATDLVLEGVLRATGSKDPIKERKDELNRIRVNRHRHSGAAAQDPQRPAPPGSVISKE